MPTPAATQRSPTVPFLQKLRDALAWRREFLTTHLARGVLARAPRYRAVFESWTDFVDYAQVVTALRRQPVPRALRPKVLAGRTVACRPATSDPWVLWDVFCNEFQLPPPEVAAPRSIVDLGANVGYTAAYFAAKYPDATVLAVEMDADNYAVARANIESFGERCTLVHAAVWDRDGDLEYEGGEEQGFHVVTSKSADAAGQRRRVRSRALESLFTEHGLESIDYVKMDIEGAEDQVLMESAPWLRRVRALKIELHPPATAEECSRRLERAGFLVRADDRHDQCIVAVRRDQH